MDNDLFVNIKKLYDFGLYECVIPAASLLSSLYQNDRNAATLEMEYQLLLYLSSANFKERHWQMACKQLESALLMRKTMARYKTSVLTSLEFAYSHFSEIELRYRIAVCYREMGEFNLALKLLQVVPAKERTPRINMLLARLLHHRCATKKDDLIIAYKDVLSDCPMSLTAIEALLELRVGGNEVNSLVVNASRRPNNIEWLSSWIKGHAEMYARKHLEAAKTFQKLNDTNEFRQNELLLTQIGKCLYYYGRYTQAEHYLSTAVMINPHNMNALCPLAVVYELNSKKKPDSEKLIPKLPNSPSQCTSAHWFILAQQHYMNAKIDRALSFTERALSIDPRNVEALLLRGKLFLSVMQYKEAIGEFRSAQNIASYRFEVYKGLFHCYVGQKRIREAQEMCAFAVRSFETSPRGYTMFARTLFHSTNPEAKKSAKKFVEKALKIDEHYTPGVALMAEIYQYEGEPQAAITLLKKQVMSFPHPKLFTILGDLLSKAMLLEKAVDCYTRALRLEPSCQDALEGIAALAQVARTPGSKRSELSSPGSDSDSSPPPMDFDWVLNPVLSNEAPPLPEDVFSDQTWDDIEDDKVNSLI